MELLWATGIYQHKRTAVVFADYNWTSTVPVREEPKTGEIGLTAERRPPAWPLPPAEAKRFAMEATTEIAIMASPSTTISLDAIPAWVAPVYGLLPPGARLATPPISVPR
jgi:hypothetical protein